jgi:hypothetical protein
MEVSLIVLPCVLVLIHDVLIDCGHHILYTVSFDGPRIVILPWSISTLDVGTSFGMDMEATLRLVLEVGADDGYTL